MQIANAKRGDGKTPITPWGENGGFFVLLTFQLRRILYTDVYASSIYRFFIPSTSFVEMI